MSYNNPLKYNIYEFQGQTVVDFGTYAGKHIRMTLPRIFALICNQPMPLPTNWVTVQNFLQVKIPYLTHTACSECHKHFPPKHMHRHHDDYDKPLRVRWLCRVCHHKFHDAHPEITHDFRLPLTRVQQCSIRDDYAGHIPLDELPCARPAGIGHRVQTPTRHKLTPEQVKEIWLCDRQYNTIRKLAFRYGVLITTITDVINRKTWRSITNQLTETSELL